VSAFRRQAHIDAPVRVIWELVSNPNRHPEWIPRVVEIECDEIGQGCTYRRWTDQTLEALAAAAAREQSTA
jgi:ligand-binding SRPBCC domain-containing protein